MQEDRHCLLQRRDVTLPLTAPAYRCSDIVFHLTETGALSLVDSVHTVFIQYAIHTVLYPHSTLFIQYAIHTVLYQHSTLFIQYAIHTVLHPHSTLSMQYAIHTVLSSFSTLHTVLCPYSALSIQYSIHTVLPEVLYPYTVNHREGVCTPGPISMSSMW